MLVPEVERIHKPGAIFAGKSLPVVGGKQILLEDPCVNSIE
jgi:hypothetical protein